MKRRGFLQILGGAIAAPLMPQASLGAATKVGYPASALHAAIYHAQSRVNFSVFALATKLGLSLDQAEALMKDMSARGILGPLQGTTKSGRWALSKIWERPFVDAAAAQKVARRVSDAIEQVKEAAAKNGTGTGWKEVEVRPLRRFLGRLAFDQGHVQHPRCARIIE